MSFFFPRQSTPWKGLQVGEVQKCAAIVIHMKSQGHYLTSTNVIFTYFNLLVCNESLFLFLVGECLHPLL